MLLGAVDLTDLADWGRAERADTGLEVVGGRRAREEIGPCCCCCCCWSGPSWVTLCVARLLGVRAVTGAVACVLDGGGNILSMVLGGRIAIPTRLLRVRALVGRLARYNSLGEASGGGAGRRTAIYVIALPFRCCFDDQKEKKKQNNGQQHREFEGVALLAGGCLSIHEEVRCTQI